MEIFRFCNKYILKYKFLFVFYILLNIVIGFFNVIIPLLTGKIVDNLTYIKSKDILVNYCILFAIVNVINMLLGFLSSYINIKLQSKSTYNLNKHVLEHLQKVSILYFSNKDTVYLNDRINNDSTAIIIFCIEVVINVVVNIFTMFFTVMLLIHVNYMILLIILVLVILYIVIYKVLKKMIYIKVLEVKEARSNFFSKLNEQIFNIRFIRIHSISNIFSQRLDNSFNTLIKKLISSQKLSYLYTSCDLVISLIGQVSIFFIGGFAIINGEMTIGTYVIMTNYFSLLLKSTKYFFNLGKSYQDNLVSYNRINEILEVSEQKHGNHQINQIDNIKVTNLIFNYEEKNIYNNYNIEFKKGKIYGLIGSNGTGKSTLINLILGVYINDYDGLITYNNIDIKEIDINQARLKNIGVTEQEPILIPDTLINNITLQKYYDINLINKYIDILGLDKYVLSLANGIHTIIDNRSSNISGGEKQKISMLRMFLKNPEVMIFDEPTSALDVEGKEKFIKYIKGVKSDKIIIIVSHDNFIYDIADNIVELKT